MYLLRYVSADAADAGYPVASVQPGVGSKSTIEIISAPGTVAGQLGRPGSCVVVLAAEAGELQIGLRRRHAGGSLEASLRLESIGTPDHVEESSLASQQSMERLFSPSVKPVELTDGANAPLDFSLMAHLARRGDVEVGAGQWAAGPDAPTPIEGLEIRSPQRAVVRIESQALVSGRPPRWSDWVLPGSFAGSRGRSLPLIGARFRLTGSESHRFELAADALFLGSAIVSKRGREIEFVSAAGLDPLIGLRLAVLSASGQAANPVENSQKREREPRVRIFRAAAG
jgi:hypothetical protein